MTSRIGMWYVTGPADRSDVPADPEFCVYTVVEDVADVPGCVMVENLAKQRFPVPAELIDEIAFRD
ncbi:MAG: hypothetical protein ACRD28_00730 [Acidobacteriaceae bacterium]